MNLLKVTAGAVLCVSMASFAFGQSEPQATPEGGDASVEFAQERIDNFLSQKGWGLGPNKGGKFFVASGTGVILAKPGSKGYMVARNNAFTKAMLAAKQEMVLFLGQEISRQIEQSYEEPALIMETQEEIEEMPSQDPGEMSLMEKGKLLIHTEVNTMLTDRGVDMSTPEGQEQAKEEVKTLLSESKFSDVKSSIARNECAGLTAYKTFDSQPEGEQGEIGVICVYTPKMGMMAAALLGRGEGPPKKEAKEPIKDQISGDPQVLACSFGVQPRIDENGNVVLVSFAHGAPRTKSRSSMNAASKKARLSADAEIRSFAGEMVGTASTLDSAESYQEFENAAGEQSEVYSNEESFKESTSAMAAKLNIAGIQTVKSVEWEHPVTGAKGVTVVRIWSPASSDQARMMSDTLNKMAGSRGGAGRGAPQPKSEAPSKKAEKPLKGSNSGEGQEGDDDAFD